MFRCGEYIGYRLTDRSRVACDCLSVAIRFLEMLCMILVEYLNVEL